MLLDDIKVSLRITNTAFDGEIVDLIEEAKQDLRFAGISSVKANDETDPIIKRAIKTYCKSQFGFDNPDADRLYDSYIMLKQHLALAGDYKEVSIV